MKSKNYSASIIGASGYAGGELIRILISHPQITINQVTSQKHIDSSVTVTHPNLRGQTDLKYCDISDLQECDILFIALPNGASMKHMQEFSKKAKYIIDLGADFRLKNADTFESWYQTTHHSPQLTEDFIYGLVELHRSQIKKAKYIACGGCEATAVILALYPLVKHKLLSDQTIIADVKIGSSAAGSKSSGSSHHPERQGVLRSYKPTRHRHQAEIHQELGVKVDISATAVNLVRGILATIHTNLRPEVTEKDVWKAYRRVYGSEPYIRIVKQKTGLYRYPEPKIVWGTNFCDIGFEKDPTSNRLVVLSAIDNLVKGTAGQAIQAVNCMLDLPEETGLEFTGLHPV